MLIIDNEEDNNISSISNMLPDLRERAKMASDSGLKARNVREEYIDKILEIVNPGRVEAGYSKYTFSRVAGQLKKIGVDKSNIYQFYQECERANNFGKFYHWRIKQDKYA